MTIDVRRLVSANPVALKELRGRMRGMRAFAVLTVYLLLMSGFAVTLYILYAASLSLSDSVAQGGQIGRTLFTGIVGIELFLITFIVPAFTSGAITGERERQTYDLLRTTLLSARSIVFGKLLSALAYVFLLLLSAVPLQSLAFLFGGVTEAEIALAFVILLVTAVTLGTIGIYFSSIMLRTLAASIATYGFALLITIGLPLLMLIIVSVLGPFFVALSGPNMSVTLKAVLVYGFGILVSTNPLATALFTQDLLINRQEVFFFSLNLTGSPASINIPLVSPWVVFTLFYGLVSLVMLVLSIRRLNRIEGESE